MNWNTKLLIQPGLSILIFSSVACQNSETQQANGLDSAGKKPLAPTEDKIHTVPKGISMDQQITDALSDLANRIGIAADDITIKEARSVQWGSGAMGCPKPGMNYTQAIVPGVQLLLEAEDTIYYYHGETGKSLFYCPSERVKAPAYGQGLEVM